MSDNSKNSQQLSSQRRSQSHNYGLFAGSYSNLEIEKTYFLAFRDIPKLIKRYSSGRRALDHGCGAGRSTRFLKSLGLQAIGVDISKDMLREAVQKDPCGDYRLISEDSIQGIESESVDLIFQSFALLEYPSLELMASSFREFHRVLCDSGIAIVITASEEGFKYDWASFLCKFPENENLKSGEQAKVLVRDTDIIFQDYYWTDYDIRNVFKSCGFEILTLHHPLADGTEPYEWVSELEHSNWSIYVAKKAR